jgi:hypothetical protein
MSSLYPEKHPRWAPYNLYVLTSLGAIEEARSAGEGTECPVGARRIAAIYAELVQKGIRPYDGTLPYVIPDNPLFAPKLFTDLLAMASQSAELLPTMTEGEVQNACALAYYHIHLRYLAAKATVSGAKIFEILRDTAIRVTGGGVGSHASLPASNG